MFTKMGLKTKLLSGYTFSFLFLIFISGLGIHVQNGMKEDIEHVSQDVIPQTALLGEMRVNAMGAVRNATVLAISDLPEEMIKEYDEKLEKRIAAFEKAHGEFKKFKHSAEETAIVHELDKNWAALVASLRKIDEFAKEHKKDSHEKAMEVVKTEVEADMDAFTATVKKLDEIKDKSTEGYVAAAKAEAQQGFWISLGSSAAGILLSILIGLYIVNSVSRQLSLLIEKLTSGAAEISQASSMVSDSSTELSEGVTQQASALQETAASVDEISAMVKRNSENATVSIEKSGASREATKEGSSAIQEMLKSMQEISASNEAVTSQTMESNQQISEITKVISEIANKTKVINDIVFQTKLLSFNASVEAARAGEHGKGFAVVAEEVGNLAQMSGNAAQEISSMLESSIKKVEGIVSESTTKIARLLEDSKKRVETGTLTARRCGEVLTHIDRSISELDKMVHDISSASKEQATGVGEISKAMNQLNQVTQQNSAISQKSAAASQQLNGEIQEIRSYTMDLSVLLKGASGAEAVPEAVAKKRRSSKEGTLAPVLKLQRSSAPLLKKAAGGGSFPSENDPRFEDV